MTVCVFASVFMLKDVLQWANKIRIITLHPCDQMLLLHWSLCWGKLKTVASSKPIVDCSEKTVFYKSSFSKQTKVAVLSYDRLLTGFFQGSCTGGVTGKISFSGKSIFGVVEI